MFRYLGLLLILILLTSCASEPSPPVSIYGLDPVKVTRQAQQTTRSDRILMLGRIHSSRAFSDNGIVYTDAAHGRNHYAYSRWADSPVDMVQIVLLDALEQSGLFKAVVSPSSEAQADLLLEATLLDFSHHMLGDRSSEGRIRIHFILIDRNDGSVIASREFAAAERASSRDARGGVDALNKATASVTREMVEWIEAATQ